MESIILIFSSILDIFILKTFLTHFLGRPKAGLPPYLFYISICFVEVLLLINMQVLTIANTASYTITIVNSAISIITTFFLCFLITNKILTILSASIVFQIMVLLSERLCLIISYFMYQSEITNEYSYTITMNLMSKLFLLIFVSAH